VDEPWRGAAVDEPFVGRVTELAGLDRQLELYLFDRIAGAVSGESWEEPGLPPWQSKESHMSTQRQAMQDYLDSLVKRADFTAYYTDDVVASFEGTDQRAAGREAAGQLIRYVHEGAFDARMELKSLLVDAGKAAIEADFVGTHIAEFAGLQATGREVRVPYSVVYDLQDDKISALRIYFPMGLLMEQLTS